jgi:hypothetical protein
MKNLSSISWLLLTLALFCGCGGGTKTSGSASGLSQDPPPDPPAQGLNATGNWEFSTTSTAGFPPVTIAGSIAQSGVSVQGAVHVDGSPCFDRIATVGLTGGVDGTNVSLTSKPVTQQVFTSTGSIAEDPLTNAAKFTGTYSIHGGCADGDQGNITGVQLAAIEGNWAGDLTSETRDINRVAVVLAQGTATSEGNFSLTGTALFESGTCFQRGTIKSGTFPSGSYVMGRDVRLEIETDNGVITFLGMAKGDGLIRGNYTVAGGTCESTGTGYLSPWEY